MARVEIPIVVDKLVSGNWQPASGASVQVNVRGGGAATVYSAATGGTPLANPLTTDSEGRVVGYADEGSYDLVVSGSGITTYTVEVELARGDSLITIGNTKIANDAITTAKLADNSVSTAKIIDGAVTAAKLASGLAVPTGTILPYGGATAPSGYLLCDAASYATATYTALHGVIGYTFGGSGANFNVPDLRGRAPYGRGTHADVDALGESDGLAQSSRTPKHTHSIGSDGSHQHYMNHQHGFTTSGPSAGTYGVYGLGQSQVTGYHWHTGVTDWTRDWTDGAGSHSHGGSTGTGGGSAYLVVNYIIKT
jgi:microcystin-dependent protein